MFFGEYHEEFFRKESIKQEICCKIGKYLTGDLEAVLQGLCVLAGPVKIFFFKKRKKKKKSCDYDT